MNEMINARNLVELLTALEASGCADVHFTNPVQSMTEFRAHPLAWGSREIGMWSKEEGSWVHAGYAKPTA